MLPFDPVTAHNNLFQEVMIRRVIRETTDAATFELDTTEPLSYKAGQFITFVIPTRTGLVRRSYSFSSAPGELPAVTVKRVANGLFSRPMLETAEPGDRITIAGGPSGFFVLPDAVEDYELVLFFAAGSGITPVYSMIKDLLRRKLDLAILLFYSNSSPASTIFREPVERLATQHPNLLIKWFYSNQQDLLRARLSKSTLENLLSEHVKADPNRTMAYLCGPFDYMRMVEIPLRAHGLPLSNIRREVFTPDVPRPKERPPDTEAHQVTVHIKGHQHILQVQYPHTILAAAKMNKLELPYSCEAGRCGSCIAACTSGRVWMAYNEVLTDKEVAEGRVLTCQSFPVGGDATIEYF